MRRCGLAALLVLGASCSRGGPVALDAGVADAGGDAGVVVERRSVDLRTAIIYAYPEYRGTAVLETTARVTRVIPGLTQRQRDAALYKLKFERAEDGGWELNSFHLSQLAPDTLSVAVSYDPDQLGHLYIAVTGLTSMELGMYLPRELPTGREFFTLDVRYASSPGRCLELVRQAVSLLLANGQWRVEGFLPNWTDAGEVVAPSEEEVVVTSVDGARLTFHRTRGQVRVQYFLETVTPQ